jgi:hypothetical protein
MDGVRRAFFGWRERWDGKGVLNLNGRVLINVSYE